ncbi:MAG: hypothetical protein ABI652_06780, partial [Acidobacteriota bacterium]
MADAIRGSLAALHVVASVDMPPSATSRIGRWLFVLALSVYGFTAGGSLTTTDAVVAFDVTRNIVEHGTVAMSGNLLGMEAHRGADGRYYSPFGIAQSLYNIPFYVAGKSFVSITGSHLGKGDSIPKAFVALGQTLLCAAIVSLTFHLAVAVTGDVVASAVAAITLGFASVLWPYARFGFNQPLACVTLLIAVSRAYAGWRRAGVREFAAAGVWLSAALMTRHEMILAAAPIAGCLVLPFVGPWNRTRAQQLLAFAAATAGGVVVWLVFNAVRFGNPLDSGFLRDPVPGFGSPLGQGILALLFSPSASIFLYSP